MKQQNFKLGELFSGPGGIGLGAKKACVESGGEVWKIQNCWATDYDQDSCETYRLNLCPDNPNSVLCEDIRNLDFKKLKNISEIDILSFGFPCNDFSVVGEQKGVNGTFGPLYTYCIKALKFFQPKWFLAENVGGLSNVNKGRTFAKVLSEFHDAGYSVYPHLYKFDQYGVPQTRQRIIIVGIRKDVPVVFNAPSPSPYAKVDISCLNALKNPPISTEAANNEKTRQSSVVIERLRYIKPGENVFTADLPSHLEMNIKGAKISQIYKRLEPNKPAYTITGSGGGGTHVYHWSEPRALTNRERARLQTFPDDFIFTGSKESVRKQIGMAVPVDGIKVIFEAILKCFAGVKYESVAPSWEPLIHNVKEYNLSLAKKENLRILEKEKDPTEEYYSHALL